MALQAEHSRLGGGKGDFTTHILPELDIDERSSRRYVSVARLVQGTNRTRVSGSDLFDLPFPMNTWYQLASPSGQTVVKQLESGEIDPTQDAIKKALAENSARLAEERRRNEELQEEKQELQRTLDLFRDDREKERQELKNKIQAIEEEQRQAI